MTSKSKADLSAERVLRELALIEGIAKHAISPTEVQPPETPAKKASGRKKKVHVADGPPGAHERADDTKWTEHTDERSTAFEREEKLFKARITEMELSMGTTLFPSSRDELVIAHERLRPAFDAIIELFRNRQRGVAYDDRSDIYDRLRDLMQAAFRIGVQATVSTRAEHFVKPKIKRAGTSDARTKRDNNENAERRLRLEKAILQASAESFKYKLVNSLEFAGRIDARVREILGIDKKQKWPTHATIRNHIREILKAQRTRAN